MNELAFFSFPVKKGEKTTQRKSHSCNNTPMYANIMKGRNTGSKGHRKSCLDVYTSYRMTTLLIGTPCACTEYLLLIPRLVALLNISQVSFPPPTMTIGMGWCRGRPLGVTCAVSNQGRMRLPGGKSSFPSSSWETTTTSCNEDLVGTKIGMFSSFCVKEQPPRIMTIT